jgi:hypothetical protein
MKTFTSQPFLEKNIRLFFAKIMEANIVAMKGQQYCF